MTLSALPDGQEARSLKSACAKLANLTPTTQGALCGMAHQLTLIHTSIRDDLAPVSWVGWAPPSFYRRMEREQNWVLGQMSRQWTPSDLVFFACKNTSEALIALERSFDACQRTLSKKDFDTIVARCHRLADKLDVLSRPQTFAFSAALSEATEVLGQAGEWMRSKEILAVPSTMAKSRLAHDRKEIMFFIDMMREVSKGWEKSA